MAKNKTFETYLETEFAYRQALNAYNKACMALVNEMTDSCGLLHPCADEDSDYIMIDGVLIERLPTDHIAEYNAKNAFQTHHIEVIK